MDVLHQLWRARNAVRTLQSPRRTALRIPRDRRPPAAHEFASYGARSFVVPPTRVSGAAGIDIGHDVLVLENSGIAVDAAHGARLVIGDRTRLAPGAEIVCTQEIVIGEGVSSSDYVVITDTWGALDHATAGPPPPGGPVVIEDGAYLGWGCVIAPGVRVGRGAFVGEGAVVVDDVPPHTVVYGNPATIVRRHDPATGRWEGRRFP